jgi:hypothetical protein
MEHHPCINNEFLRLKHHDAPMFCCTSTISMHYQVEADIWNNIINNHQVLYQIACEMNNLLYVMDYYQVEDFG